MPVEPPSWAELREKMEAEARAHIDKALVAGNWLRNPALKDEEGVQTRLSEQPTISVVLAQSADDRSAVKLCNGETVNLTARVFEIATAKALHRNLVKVPAYWFPKGDLPKPDTALQIHGAHGAILLTVGLGNLVEGTRLADGIQIRYTPFLGIEVAKSPTGVPKASPTYDDESFD
jgi:hypothetical protein